MPVTELSWPLFNPAWKLILFAQHQCDSSPQCLFTGLWHDCKHVFFLFCFLRRVSPPKNPVHATHFSTVQHLPHSQTARCCKKNTGVWRAARAYKKPKEVHPTYVGYNYARLTPDHLPRVKVVSPVAKTESMKSFPSRLDHEVSRLCGTPLYPFPSHLWRQ